MAFAAPVHSDEAATVAEIVRIFDEQALAYRPETADEAATVEVLLKVLRTVDPDVAYEPPEGFAGTGAHDVSSLGLTVSTLGARILLMPHENGPTFAAGLHDPVYLQAVNDIAVRGAQPSEIQKLVQSEGETVRLTVQTAAEIHTLTLRPQPPLGKLASVEVLNMSPALVLRVHEFVENETLTLLANAVEKQLTVADLVVLDLRLNPGGNLFEALDAASLFLPDGVLLAATRDRLGTIRHYASIPSSRKLLNQPVVVLTSDHTASAAEAFTRALHYHGRALVAGRPTFGKCRSQRRFPLESGGTVMISNLVVLGPGEESCGSTGLQPDVLVDELELLSMQTLIRRARALLGRS